MEHPLDAFRLDGRVAVVTGASSGLGRRFARVLDAAGASVVVVARRGDRLIELVGELDRAVAVAADVAAPDTADRVVATALDTFGRLDVLVNNAGIIHTSKAVDESIDEFRRVVDVNLIGAFALARACAVPMLAAGRGSVVNISSLWGLVGIGQIPDAAYASTKAAVIGLTRELAAQWARKGVRVNAIAPGWFDTEMTRGPMFGDEAAERWIATRTPMARGGAEHELDGALLFLASDASSFVTGITLPVDGGWTAI